MAEKDVLTGPTTVEVELQGGPSGIPRRILATTTEIANGKIRVQYRAGYEHFECDGSDPDVFSWTTRTKIAE